MKSGTKAVEPGAAVRVEMKMLGGGKKERARLMEKRDEGAVGASTEDLDFLRKERITSGRVDCSFSDDHGQRVCLEATVGHRDFLTSESGKQVSPRVICVTRYMVGMITNCHSATSTRSKPTNNTSVKDASRPGATRLLCASALASSPFGSR